jgi:outer membrane cobalamin receptor
MKQFLLAVFLLAGITVSAQGTVTGTLMDTNAGMPLSGANLVETGTDNGTASDFDGNFTLKVSSNEGSVTVSYIGYKNRTIRYTLVDGTANLGRVQVTADANSLNEVVIQASGVVDLAQDRKTPVAVSTISAAEIQTKLGSQEFPEILNNSPSIYATKQGGGYGDARVNIRGFDTQNSAVLINGVPVNDMENGRVYWSNWAGLSDVASAIQVQRGLGSSKLTVSSVGGTINVVTRSAERNEGAFVSGSVGNDGYVKTIASYASGLSEKGWSGSFLLSNTRGNGYVDGTRFHGQNYYAALGYKASDKSSLELTVTGSPQEHNQRSRGIEIGEFLKYGQDGEPDIKYNPEWGMLDGKEFNFRRNFYHKPVISLNWDYELSDVTKISTVAYASFGRGGGTGEIGRVDGKRQFDTRLQTANGLTDVELIRDYNRGEPVVIDGETVEREQTNGLFLNTGNGDRSSQNGISRRSSVNSHNWYGVIANVGTELNDNLNLDFGVDLRQYTGYHYRRVTNLLGADGYLATDNGNTPDQIFTNTYNADKPWWVFGNIDDEDKIDYYNKGFVTWAGVFGQLEYTSDDERYSAFVQGAASNQGFAREEFFNEVPTEKTDTENLLGGNIKAGVNFNIDENHNVFGNAGYFSKQPLFDAVFINFGNNLNPELINEKIIGTEIGYGFRSSKFRANVNLYRTSWADRFESITQTFDILGNNDDESIPEAEREDDDVRGTANLQGVKQVHMGVEVDARLKITNRVGLRGMVSVGDWKYEGNVSAAFLDTDQTVIPGLDEQTLYLDGVKVGDAAQFTASLGLDVEVIKGLTVDANYRRADNLYAAIDATDFGSEDNNGSLELPSFGLLDAGIGFSVPFLDNTADFRFNMNNVLDETYISESDTNRFAEAGDETYNGISTDNRVFFGLGRTWNVTARFNF